MCVRYRCENRMGVKEIIQRILSHRQGLTREEVVMAIEKKKDVSGGLLTDEASARLVATEYGVKIEFRKPLPRIYIHQLVSGLTDVTVSGRVLLVSTLHVFPRPNGNGQVARLLIADKTGSIGVVLWNEKAEFTRKIKLRQIVKVSHGYVRRSRRGEMELHVGQRGSIQVAPSDAEASDFPSINDFVEKIANITEVRRKVNVKGVIQSVYPASTFQRRDETQGRVMRMVLKDKTGQIPVVFWNEKVEDVVDAKEGMAVLLMNVKVRKNRRDGLLELHVDDFANVEILGTPENFCI